ncbi:MAG: hypothetical protein WCO29_23350 [Nostocales cyanobacterium ELA583]
MSVTESQINTKPHSIKSQWETQTCILDEEQNQMIYTQQRIGRKAKITTTSLTGIQVLVEKDKDTDDDTIYTLFLQPCHSDRIKITRSLAQFLNIEVTRVDLTKHP